MRDRIVAPQLALLAVGLAALAWPASAHVAPSLDVNNRYLKLTALGDRARLAYTVYLGQQQGARLRRQLDADRDSVVTEAEARPYANELATAVAAGLTIEIDGRPVAVKWDQQHIGLGTPSVNAGALSIDLIAYLCLAGPGPKHRLSIFDRYQIADPGETEVRIEESPGVRVTRSTLGPNGTRNLTELTWRGAGSPMATDGLFVELEVGPDAAPGAGGECAESAQPKATDGDDEKPRRLWWVVGAGLLGLLAVGLLVLARARSRARD